MSWKKAVKKHGKMFKKSLSRKPGAQLYGGFKKYKDGQKDSDDYRSEAAGQLVSENVTRQAGSGQIKYTNEYMA